MEEEDYVSPETAKLLKEKGFDWRTYAYYEDEDNPNISLRASKAINWNKTEFISKPTLQEACKWLRKVHNIVIVVIPSMFWGKYNVRIYKKGVDSPIGFDGDSLCPSHEQAYDIAIKHCSKNLI